MSDCLFCKMVRKEVDANIVYEDENLLAFHDIHPQAPTHILVIPKEHIEGLSSLKDSQKEIAGNILLGAKRIAAQEGLKHFRCVFNNGEEAGQSVFHVHLHLLGGRAMNWPPG